MTSLLNIAAGNPATASFYDYQIENSLRLNRGDSANLSRTPSSEGSRQTHTISMWVKRSELGRTTRLFGSTNNSANATFHFLEFNSDDTIRYYAGTEGSSAVLNVRTNAVYRDVSAWYHIVVALDTTQATSSNRVKLYVNGTQITSLASSTYGSQNASYQINSTNIHYINNDGSSLGNNYSTFYVADVNFIDGQQLDPTSFGETKSGVWIPKDTSDLTFGTNGFRLEFGDSSAIGDDTSGNTNDFTANNLAAIDVTLDSPTNSFATLNPLIKAATYGQQADPAPTNGNLEIAMPGGTNNIAVSTFELQAPNKYRCSFELTSRGSSTNFELGICNANETLSNGQVYYNSSGFIANESATQQSGLTSANTVGDIVEILVDLDANNVKFALKENGTSTWVALGTAESITANVTNPIVWVREQGSNNINGKMDFGQLGYVGSDDGNYLPMSTANLPEPPISPMDDELPEDYFNTLLYTGNGSTQSVTGVGFQPDLLWLKSRTHTNSHLWVDSVRGSGLNGLFYLVSNSTIAEVDGTNITSLDSDGFTLDSSAGSNGSGRNFVAWNWLAGGTAVSNTEGSVSSSVSANTDAGFSIVSFAVPSSGTFTIGHGLGAKPAVIITKGRDSVDNWAVYHKSISTDENSFLQLNSTNATGTATDIWGTAQPTSTVMGMQAGTTLLSSQDAIAYCFAEIEGYSKIGSYTGNGSTDGTFVYTGFRPAFIIVKRSSATSTASGWFMADNARNPFNQVDNKLVANSNQEENDATTIGASGANDFDFLSNGFKLRANNAGTNSSGNTYIYMAFAEMPQKYSLAR